MEESNYMFKKNGTKFKKGAASFYIVAFATLILVIVVTSFAAVIVSEVTRTSNDDLAQSAYDSALAGVEDAKLAYYNYRACKEQGNSASKPTSSDISCPGIIWLVESEEGQKDCDMVAKILGKISPTGSSENDGGVLIQENTSNGNMMQQAYTCNKISMGASDYRSTLTEANPTKLIPIQVSGDTTKAVSKMKISWYSNNSTYGGKSSSYNFDTAGVGALRFPSSSVGDESVPTPPMISVQLIQTDESGFRLSDFDKTVDEAGDIRNEQTNRATMYLVPDYLASRAGTDKPDSYIGTCWKNGEVDMDGGRCVSDEDKADETVNYILASQVVKTNDRSVKNLPFVVYCPRTSDNEFVCSVEIELPYPVGAERNDDTFMIAVSLPYGRPSTDFALSFYCKAGQCSESAATIGNEPDGSGDIQIMLSSMQAKIDSTGRANNLYRRVEARIDSFGSFPYPLYGIELLGEDTSSESLLNKNLIVTSEIENSYEIYKTALGTDGDWGNGNINK